MPVDAAQVLRVLDDCTRAMRFPMLDNGYTYLAAARLSLYRSPDDWAMVIETFGFSPRAGLPDTTFQTYASRLQARKAADDFISRDAHEHYLAAHPHDEYRSIWPVARGPWQEKEYGERLAEGAAEVVIRGVPLTLPPLAEYRHRGIPLSQPPRVMVFELCRLLADVAREQVLATPAERRANVPPELTPILQLEEWRHPDVADDQRPGALPGFRQLARVLATGDPSHYRPPRRPNTHWRHWPVGGTL